MDAIVDLVLQQAFGGKHNDDRLDEERENEMKLKTGVLMKKMHIDHHASSRLIEDVANVLVLLMDEPDERINLLTKEDLEAIAASVPPIHHKYHHETDEETIDAEKRVAEFAKRNEVLKSRMYPSPKMTEASVDKELTRRERDVLSYINEAVESIDPSLKLKGPLLSNHDMVEAAKAISELSHTFVSRDKGVYVVSEHEKCKDKAGVMDDVSVVLTKLAESQAHAYKAGGRPFQEELIRIKKQCVKEDAEAHVDQSLEYLKENVKIDWEPSMPKDIGFDSTSSVQERVYVGEHLDRLAEQKKRIMALHEKELEEIVNIMKEHNKRKFLKALKKVRQEADEDQKDVERIISETFKTLETKSSELNAKYTSLFQKARLSIIEQFESSRNALYRGEDNTDTREGGVGGGGSPVKDPFMTAAKDTSAIASGDEAEGKEKEHQTQLLPWKVAVERDLTAFNMDILHNFEADNANIFAQHAHEVAAQSKEKVDKYLKF